MNSRNSTSRVSAAATAGASPEFSQLLSSTRRGARLARRFAVQQLHHWGVPYDSDLSDTAAHVVAELAANAVTHGHVPGRDFLLRLVFLQDVGRLRIEVTDACGERRPEVRRGGEDDTSGRGLLLVDALAVDWGVTERALGKTVWAELALRE
ncbi:ATP-binding protein [Streptomyces acidicola]|uniref:ATP-binding protein n=1 Tax=Streptomyces acidicola TaxID=2596892 RepID=A0A5N8X1Y7_9ACTN|nr:ATP-binding protein [Streptomyces acidicola]MPY52858.1 ATP-binding protein [Streptomyces acidicola]